MPSGWRLVKLFDHAGHDVRPVLPRRPIDGDEAAALVEVVLHERAGREIAGRAARRRREEADDLVRIHEPAPAELRHLLLVLGHRPERRVAGIAHGELQAVADGAR